MRTEIVISGDGMDESYREFLESGLITPSRMRAVEVNAMALGVSSLQMMESAGKSLSKITNGMSPGKVLILCGKGNNGADGMVAARYLDGTTVVEVWYHNSNSKTPECEIQLRLLNSTSVRLFPFINQYDLQNLNSSLSDADLVIDALFGTGVSGELSEPMKSVVGYVNDANVPVLSVDVPTPGIHASTICAFHRAKIEGSLTVPIGIPLEAEIFTGPGDLTQIKRKKISAHKGEGGSVLVVGGGPYQGAPYLAGMAALRVGADIVRIASPDSYTEPDLIYTRLKGQCLVKEHIETLLPLVEKADVLICGNGLGPDSHESLLSITSCAKKAVVDADGLRLPLPSSSEVVYTPHSHEFERIFKVRPPLNLLERAKIVKGKARNGTVLLKGETDIISDGSRVRFNRTGCSEMTTGGTGDVLAGITGGLLCRVPAFDAACVAAYLNGKCGEFAANEKGDGLIGSDLLQFIPGILYGDENR